MEAIDIGMIKDAFDAISTGNYFPLAGLALSFCALVLRYLFSKAFPKLNTDRGGLLFVLGLGAVGAVVHAIVCRAPFDLLLFGSWAKVVSSAIAIYVVLKKGLMPSDGPKVEIPPPSVSAPIFLAWLALGLCACGHDVATDLRAGITQAEKSLLAGKADVDARDAAAKTAIVRKAVEVCMVKPQAERELCVNSEGEARLALHVEERAKVTQVLTEAQATVAAAAAAIPLVERGIMKDTQAVGYLTDILRLAVKVKDAVAAFGVSLPKILTSVPGATP